MIVDAYQPHANFVSAREIEVGAPAERAWEVLPELPVALRNSRLAPVAAVPLWVASVIRGERGRLGAGQFGTKPWTFRQGEVLAGAFRVDRVDPGKEVVLVGRHRFADYATSFYVEPIGADRSRLANVTRATFSTAGLGRVYLLGVHVFHDAYTDWMLRLLRRLAETRQKIPV